MNTNEESMQKRVTGMAIIIALLLGVIAFLLFNRSKQTNMISQQGIELDEAEVLQEDLQTQYEEVMKLYAQSKSELWFSS